MEGLSSVLEVVIGLAFIYLLLSLLVSAAVEYLEMWLRKRGRLLRFGLLELLSKRKPGLDQTKLVEALYLNPLIYALYKGEPNAGRALRGSNLPSYIPPNTFVLALLDELLKHQGLPNGKANLSSASDIVALIEQSPQLPDNLKSALRLVLSQVSNDDYNLAIKKLEVWYSGSTDRVSGWYKKHTQRLALALSLGITIAANVDTLYITQALMVNSSLRTSLVQAAQSYRYEPENTSVGKGVNSICSTAEECEKQAMMRLRSLKVQLASLGLPIGWQHADPSMLNIGTVLNKGLGWLLTVIAVSFGAPFWFDVLNRFMSFRSAVKPRLTDEGKSGLLSESVLKNSPDR